MKKIFKSIGYGLSVPFVLLATFFALLFAKRKAKKYKKDPNSIFLQERLKTVYKLFNKFLYLKRVEVVLDGFEKLPAKQMLFIADHKHILDPMVIFTALYETNKIGPTSFICKNELSKHWYTRCVIELMDGIFIQRDDGRSIYDCYLKQMENVKKGYSIVVFPEGTRVPGEQFKEFNPTTLKVAFQNFIAIEPIVIYGADAKRKIGNKKKVYVSALRPVQPNNFINIKQEQLMETLKNSIVDKYIELRAVAYGKGK
ncbi:MAG: 1-acyl-sn-glycerol-3-phosphate acyltransferase [Mycoplasma sp.]|nr:1-acyl-sn-glycerol-3-phosphate acyltransferase [Candidatus Hennigella equi]